MGFERLSPMDSSFLHIEDSVSHMHIGSVSVMEGPPPAYEVLRDMLDSKLPLVRRYRQVVRTVPLDLGRPLWADDPWFDIDYHLRRTALPSPGGDAELCGLVGRVMGQPLDRSRPLWEMWMVEGLPDGQWAIVSKVHHCMVDGVAGADLLGLIMDLTPEITPPGEPPPWIPALPPPGWELAFEAMTGMLSSPFELARLIRARTRLPRRVVGQAAGALSTLAAAAGNVTGPRTTSLNGKLGPHRRWAPASLPVERVKEIRARHGGTFNDVVLSMISRGLRDLLISRGDASDLPLRSLVPVSVRGRDERGRAVGDGTFANKVTAVLVDLPVHIDDPVERLRSVSSQMDAVKDSGQATAGEVLTSLGGFAPPMLLSLAGRLGTKVPQRMINTITTNVPGPQLPLYAAGRRMLRCYPYVPLGIRMRVGVAIFSYDGMVTFGVTGDYDSATDLDVVARGIEAAATDFPPGVVIDLRNGRPVADRKVPAPT